VQPPVYALHMILDVQAWT